MSDQQNVTSEHYSIDHLTKRVERQEQFMEPALNHISNIAADVAELKMRVDRACKAGNEDMAALNRRIDNLGNAVSDQEKRIDLIADDDPYNPGELARIGERITTLEARITNEASKLRRDINVANDHRKTLSERVEGYHRNTNADNEQLEKWTRDQFQGVSDALDAFRDWGQEHTTSDGEWHATLSKQLTGAKIVLAAGGIAIAYLVGRSTR